MEFRGDLWRQKTRVTGLSCDVVCVILCLAVLVEVEHRLVTDTERRTDTGGPCTASRGKNLTSAYLSSKRVIDLAGQGGRSERDKLNRRRSTKLTVPPSSDSRLLVYHSNHQAPSIGRFSHGGLLVTADTCLLYGCIFSD